MMYIIANFYFPKMNKLKVLFLFFENNNPYEFWLEIVLNIITKNPFLCMMNERDDAINKSKPERDIHFPIEKVN